MNQFQYTLPVKVYFLIKVKCATTKSSAESVEEIPWARNLLLAQLQYITSQEMQTCPRQEKILVKNRLDY